ncbi:GNAT family N-acetyltransferase [Ketogulonicigenium vulgare]|uniref:Acetyltransferase, GNAT family protein n=1 Tax=Ketogulonicigenium vulgare (strain WSH-001) TaxID=759362 RepID=F9Y3A6_KETVW|nr:GNAT family N-acetyltransferase [Ketogulonicigenium vulgare]ADO42143.1 GCN5-related N-acetyltransferase [Ketogulonicigenium vulgare Y25]AEM40347.1 Acetyltransferase, GNAT family protein [Ketogulonicigenium vulgare WSH-001]ALJ80541.1 GNAT family acetyltransferase [Ketogulonicigenium vulgare]ANW33362.1 GNAT family acetyltransferase [Ketogulonicigenium vulgare]AOZ54060.1 GCN5-related N-acetyltransferase [Ketogulonicigenium vulgare]
MRLIRARAGDAARLADIRVAAMRDSLMAVGRFDEARARARLLDNFTPADTMLIYIGDLMGFYVLRPREGHLYLDHLYLKPEHQGQGVGRQVIAHLQGMGQVIRLIALQDSAAAGFYAACGFRLLSSDGLDSQFEWQPE